MPFYAPTTQLAPTVYDSKVAAFVSSRTIHAIPFIDIHQVLRRMQYVVTSLSPLHVFRRTRVPSHARTAPSEPTVCFPTVATFVRRRTISAILFVATFGCSSIYRNSDVLCRHHHASVAADPPLIENTGRTQAPEHTLVCST